MINEALVSRLVASQFPQWKDLPIRRVVPSGWDNRTFRLGERMLVRMPSATEYAVQIEKEQLWLPRLASLLPLSIPEPLAQGGPEKGYPWSWSIYRWLEGRTIADASIANLYDIAISLSNFLNVLQRIDTKGGPLPGTHNFYRGGSLAIYDAETRKAIALLKDDIDVDAALEIWKTALKTTWHDSPVWIHGDISPGNLLVQEGQLSSVIDFGGLAVGDPACDLAIAWTLFESESRKTFRSMLLLDAGTWERGRAWALWKALIVVAGITDTTIVEAERSRHTIDEILADHRRSA
ncbi:aminoglycoside phosphotransferase family protein [bacterium]|jgi:aminoglycoside phosphotransferase (APT) family kinase protein|nr:aminoglycoside phosphotransferase family protein [bacterium]MBT5014824.1 aminoglycoside phosphotransferase family protein [bacterium]